MQEIQSYETNRKRKINSEHKEIEQLKTLVSDSENDIRRMRQRVRKACFFRLIEIGKRMYFFF